MKHELPDGWEWKKLGDVCKIQTGKKDVNEGNINGKYSFFTCASLPLMSDEYSFDGEAIVLPGNGVNVGQSIYYYGKFEAYQRTYVLNNFLEYPKYIAYFLKCFWKSYLQGKHFGSATNYIKMESLENFTISFPTFEIQHKIVTILEKAEETKKFRAQADELTQQLLQSVFLEMFGDSLTNPKGWAKVKIADIAESIEAGWSVNGEQRFKEKNEYGVLKVSAVTQGIFLPEEHKAIKPGTVLKKVVTPEKGDVLFSRANTLELVGATCLIRDNYPELLLPDKLWKIKLNKNLILPEVFKFILSTPSMRGEISKKSTGTSGSMYNISMAKLKLIHISIPPIEIQDKFSKIYDLYDNTQKKQEESRNNLDYLFNAIMQKSFTGELVS